jgi:CRISPR-associated protein Cas1
MQTHPTLEPPVVTAGGLLFLRGYAASLRVHRGQLVARCGAGPNAPESRFSRGSRRRIRRVVILGRGGFTTWEALSWLKGVGASFVCLDTRGETLAFSGHDGPDQAALRRAQARGSDNGSALNITRTLLAGKLRGQAAVTLEYLPSANQTLERLEDLRRRIEEADRIEQMVAAEAKAARLYWSRWEAVPVQFARRDLQRMPPHWQTVGERHSPLSSGPRLATTAAHATWNYLYSLAEFECRIALLAIGLDPGLGWFHADVPYRDSAALDLIEIVRPEIDRYVAGLLRDRTFSMREFREGPDGRVRVSSPLAQLLADDGLRISQRAVAVPAEEVGRIVASAADRPALVRTRLTQADRKRGRKATPRQSRKPPSACRHCGLVLADRDRQYCDECLRDVDRARAAKLSQAGKATLAAMRSSMDDPARSPEALARKRDKSRAASLAARAWEREHGKPDPNVYNDSIYPVLREMSVPRLMQLTGLSQYHCWQVRAGRRRLHARFWGLIVEWRDKDRPQTGSSQSPQLQSLGRSDS